jgi:DNA replication protein DnaC
MNTINDIISRNWRRKTFDLANKKQIDELKIELFSYVQKAFFDPANNQPVLNEVDKRNLSTIFYWLVGNCNPLMLNKAPIISGDFGTGKSVTMKGVLKFINKHYSHDSVIGGITNPIYTLSHDMANAFKNNDMVMINKFKSCSMLGIDDLGYEPKEVSFFGTVCNPFEEIIMSRYDKRKTTIITTNLSLDEIGKRYGWQVYDRVKQMCFLVEFNGNSKRI